MKEYYAVYDVAVRDFAIDFLNKFRGDVIGQTAIICDESHKTLASVEYICKDLLQAEADRSTILLAIGGGVCSDICGLVASIYKRGISLEIVPTTLLAMADAAVGGKNGVNLDGVKNAIGTFKLPSKIHYRREALSTLSDSQIKSGGAEILKTFLLFDEKRYHKAVSLLSALDKGVQNNDSREQLLKDLSKLAEDAAKYKMRIVKKDPFDKGRRHLLNFGHTFGHAIEWKSAGTLSHGESVAIGIIKALRLSEAKGIAPKGLADRVASDFENCGLPTQMPFAEQELLEAIDNDKKLSNGKLDFVFLKRPGKATLKKSRIKDLL